MVDPEIEARIEAGLKAGGRSQRGLAREFGLSRGTVGAMASGRRPADLSRQHAIDRASRQASIPGPAPIVGRCPRCGRLIELPCRSCRDELARGRGSGVTRQESGARGQESGVSDEVLNLGLQKEEEGRYLALRHAKETEFLGQVIDAAEASVAEHESEDLPTVEELAEIEAKVGSR